MNHLNRILSRLEKVTEQGSGYIACCPAHDDTNPSLSVTLGTDGYVHLKCRSAMCKPASILTALELSPSDLFPDADDDLILADSATSDLITDDQPTAPPPVIENPAAHDKIYQQLLGLLPLSEDHLQNLQDRGLDEADIHRLGYRTMLSDHDANNLISELRKQFSEEELLAVPGFRKSQETLSLVKSGPGLWIPVRNLDGQIVAIKVRHDNVAEGQSKYTWLSGGGGVSCGSPTHVPLGTPAQCPEVRLTEGQLKADIAYLKTGLATLGVPGVNNWKSALPVLQQLGVKKVRLAFDMDLLVKQHVAVEALKCANELKENGFTVCVESWFLPDGKGIDDLLVAGKKPQLLKGEGAFLFLRKHAGVHETSDQTLRISEPQAKHEVLPHDEPRSVPADQILSANTPLPAAEVILKIEALPEVEVPLVTVTPEVALPPQSQVMPFPIEVFPVALQQFAQQSADSIGCPVDFIGVPMLSVAATAIGASRAMKSKDGWLEAPRFYHCIVARPGSGKSPAVNKVCRVLHTLQNRFQAEYERAKIAYETVMAEKKTRSRASAVLNPEVEATDADPAANTVSNQPASPAAAEATPTPPTPLPPAKPSMQRITVADATTESLAPILAKNPRGIIMIRDELTAWIQSLDQYRGGRGGDRQFFISCWSGEPTIVDRKSQPDPIIISKPFLNVLGGIQPDMLSIFHDDKRREDGFIDRILFAFPDEPGRHGWIEQCVEQEVELAWSRSINLLLNLKMYHSEEYDVDLPQPVNFTKAGKRKYIEWYNAHEQELDAPDLPSQLRGHWAKLRSYALRLILVVHLLRYVANEVPNEEVDEESVRRGLLLVDYFKSHTRKVFSQISCDSVDRQVELALAWIRRHGGECTLRDLLRSNVAGIKKMSEANSIVKDLVDRGFGELVDRLADNGRKVTWFVANEQCEPALDANSTQKLDGVSQNLAA